MLPGFFTSKAFVISGAVALAIVGGAAGAYYAGGAFGGFALSAHSACHAPALAGSVIASQPPQVAQDRGGHVRTETYTLDASSFAGGSLDLCVSVGDIRVEPAAGDDIELVFTIEGDHSGTVERTVVDAAFHADGDRIVVGAWESVRGRAEGVFRGDSAEVRLTLRVPPSGAYAISAHSDVGSVHVESLLVSTLDLGTAVGGITARAVDLAGDARVRSDVGDVAVAFASVQAGNITATSEVGDVVVELPLRADVGYDAEASTSVGEVTLRLGDTESHESSGDGPGEREAARSSGYATKPAQVVVRASTDVGDAHIIAS